MTCVKSLGSKIVVILFFLNICTLVHAQPEVSMSPKRNIKIPQYNPNSNLSLKNQLAARQEEIQKKQANVNKQQIDVKDVLIWDPQQPGIGSLQTDQKPITDGGGKIIGSEWSLKSEVKSPEGMRKAGHEWAVNTTRNVSVKTEGSKKTITIKTDTTRTVKDPVDHESEQYVNSTSMELEKRDGTVTVKIKSTDKLPNDPEELQGKLIDTNSVSLEEFSHLQKKFYQETYQTRDGRQFKITYLKNGLPLLIEMVEKESPSLLQYGKKPPLFSLYIVGYEIYDIDHSRRSLLVFNPIVDVKF